MATKNDDTLKRLVHYVAYRCVEDPGQLGTVKLNKILWYSDLTAYRQRGASITGEKYVKRQHGPAADRVYSVVKQLDDERKVVVRQFGTQQREYLALATPDLEGLNPDDLRIVDDWIETVCNKHTAHTISLKSHDAIWELAEIGEEIPYYAMLASELHEVTPEDIDWAKAQAGI